MQGIPGLIARIDRVTQYTGVVVAWLSLSMAILTAIIVSLRYGFGVGSIAMQELIVYMHACLFLLGAAYTLKSGSHVRVDIFYRRFSPRTRAWINSLGAIIFLLPLCIFMSVISWDFVSNSWAIKETSAEPGGIPAVYLLKSLILVMSANLLLQGTAELLRNAHALVMCDGYPE